MKKNKRPKMTNIHTGIDIGSTKIRCSIVEIDAENNHKKLLGIGTSKSTGIKLGSIINREKFVEEMEKALIDAERIANVKVEHAWLSVSGEHIRGINTQGAIAIDRSNATSNSNKTAKIDKNDIKRVLEMAKAVSFPADREILHILPQEYVVDAIEKIKDPIGMSGRRLEARVHLVTVTTTIASNFINCAEELELNVNGLIFQGLAAGSAVLDEDDKEMGVVVADIGAKTTDIAVYFGGCVRHTGVIPIGADSITNDIAVMLRISRNEAERIKLKYGSAKATMASADLKIDVPVNNTGRPMKVSEHELSRYVEARMIEIFQLIGREISRSDCYNKLSYGLVLTGGGSLLPNITILGEETLKIRVRIGRPHRIAGIDKLLNISELASVIGLPIWHTNSNDILLNNSSQFGTRQLVGKIAKWFKSLF